MPRKKFTDEQLIQMIKDKAKEIGRVPKRRDFKFNQAVKNRFGSWNNGLIAAGFTPTTIKNLSKKEILQIIKKWSKKNNKTPSISDWINAKNKGEYVPEVRFMCKKFKMTWNEIMELAGLEPNLERQNYDNLSDNEILKLVKKELERLNTNKWMEYDKNRNKDIPSVSFLRNRFKCTWNEILKKLGFKDYEINCIRRTKEELIQILISLKQELGHTPSISDLYKHGYNENIFVNNFNSYNNALIIAGLEPNCYITEVDKNNEELLKMYIEFSNKIGKPASVKDLNNSNEIYNADIFTIRFGGMTNLKKLAGFKTNNSHKKYTKDKLKNILLNEYKKYGRKPYNSEINKNKDLPSLSTFLRYFKTTKMNEVWNEVLNNK